MPFVKLLYNSRLYRFEEADDLKMDILGLFLTDDVTLNIRFYKEWALDVSQDVTVGNITDLEKKDGYILLRHAYSQEKVPTTLKMTTAQFIQILDDWDTKVCKARPQEVIIKHQDDQFIIETRG